MKVLKFGGTSVGTIESLTNVKNIIENLEEPAIVVVSALGGLTDKLIATAKSAAEGKDDFMVEMQGIRNRHYDIIDALITKQKSNVKDQIDILLNKLEDRYHGLSLIKSLPETTLAEIVSFGERMSSIIVSAIINNAEHHDSTKFVKTEKWFNKNIADRELTNKLIREEFQLPLKQTAVIGGFISTDKTSGEITNLGRGGSDYTAALVAAALDAEMLEIWTDVDGFLTADPRVIPDAMLIPHMSFVESMELCSFGAKVVYPPTIYPVFHKNIPIKILNTFNSSAPGTLISDDNQTHKGIRGISSLANTSLIKITGEFAINVAEINSRAYNTMARNGISMYLVSPPSDTKSFFMALSSDALSKSLDLLNIEFAPEISRGDIADITGEHSLSVLAIVGEGIKSIESLGINLKKKLEMNGIQVKAMNDGASETTIALVVQDNDVKSALRLIHDVCFENIKQNKN